MELEQFDKFTAEFRPKRTDDLCFEALTWVGAICEWSVGWMIETGVYKGQWACIPLVQVNEPPFGWIPFCDLKVL